MKKSRWKIIHEDEHLIIIDKPARFLTIPDRYDKTKPSLFGTLSERRDKIYINHRLDKDTSGLILFTKNEEAHRVMSDAFENRQLDKHYLTIVHNTPIEEVGLIDLPLASRKGRGKGMVVNHEGKESFTKYKILESCGRFSYLEVKILTGRQHQIRVHMKAIGCPVLCDKLYSDSDAFYLSSIKKRMNLAYDEEERPLLVRVALHASKLKFHHPITQEELEFESAIPKDMKAVLNQLSKLVK